MNRSVRISVRISKIAALALCLAAACFPSFAQSRTESVFNGRKIIFPESSIPKTGRIHTNYFFVDSDKPNPQPNPGDETPGSFQGGVSARLPSSIPAITRLPLPILQPSPLSSEYPPLTSP